MSKSNVQVVVQLIGRAGQFIFTMVGDRTRRVIKDEHGKPIAKVTVKRKRRK